MAASAVTEQLFDSVNSSVCTISAVASDGTYISRGSGFILQDSGLLVTNAHVVAGLRQAKAKCGATQHDIKRIVRFDENIDLAIGEVGAVNAPGLAISTTDDVRPGSQVFVFGSPWGLEGTITPGLASGPRTIEGKTYLQMSGPISAGNSGGPVTDETGAVIGIAVASLEADNNISFAIPASAISGLPEVDLQPAELAMMAYGAAASTATQQSSSGQTRPMPTANGASFRGNAFGASCGEVAVAEYSRQEPTGPGDADIRFDPRYDGQLEMSVDLLGTPATVLYDCDAELGMTAGHYLIRGNADGIDRIENVLRGKYGSGITQPISEADATDRGCMFNFSLPGSRNYRPSELTTWRVDDRFHIDLLQCGGRSKITMLSYSDPVLVSSTVDPESPTSGVPGYRETDL